MASESYVAARIAQQSLQVSSTKLRAWADAELIPSIRTPGGTRLYDVATYIQKNRKGYKGKNASDDKQQDDDIRIKICYCRVSSPSQKDDLQRQIADMRSRFPDHTVISDIGSGINWKRKGLEALLEQSLAGSISEIVVAYRDRLARFAYELLERIFFKCGVKILVLNQGMETSEPGQRDLADDLLAIINVFNCRVNGRRKYGRTKAIKCDKPKETKKDQPECYSQDPHSS
jgi:predicted site-specific integrase-resolvase